MTIKVEKGVKIPPRKCGAPSEFTKTLAAMKVLDSVFIKGDNAGKCMHSWVSYNKRSERFTTRRMDGGIRIWRIK
jgi:hypothetical protein